MRVFSGFSLGLKRFLPRGLFGRTLLILIVPIFVLQGLVSFLYIERHYDRVSRQLSRTVAKQLSFIVDDVDRAPSASAARARLLRYQKQFDLKLDLDENQTLDTGIVSRSVFDLAGNAVGETLDTEIERPLLVDLYSYPKMIDISIQTNKGVVYGLVLRRTMIAERPHLLLVWTGIVSFVLVVIAVIFLRNQIRPIRQLAKAAEAFGRGQAMDSFHPSGALEIRQAARAFLKMRARIERTVEQRTQMLLGISHDLRTPLTRMKLTLAMQPETEDSQDLAHDVEQMQHMLDAFLAFGQKEKQSEATQQTNLHDLLNRIIHDTKRANPTCRVDLDLASLKDDTLVQVKPQSLRRCLQNLLENACTFGTHVRLTASVLPKRIELSIEDNGIGIPEHQRAEAFNSFNRLDNARSQNRTGNVGLGLTIARDIVHNHGGSISLDGSKDMNGLKVSIILPQ